MTKRGGIAYNSNEGVDRVVAEARDETVKALLEAMRREGQVISASGLVSDGVVDVDEVRRSVELYSLIKGAILRQGVSLPRHAHESIMDDFLETFGKQAESNVCTVKVIDNTSIDIEEFKRESETK